VSDNLCQNSMKGKLSPRPFLLGQQWPEGERDERDSRPDKMCFDVDVLSVEHAIEKENRLEVLIRMSLR
jgi:hypothetical protein